MLVLRCGRLRLCERCGVSAASRPAAAAAAAAAGYRAQPFSSVAGVQRGSGAGARGSWPVAGCSMHLRMRGLMHGGCRAGAEQTLIAAPFVRRISRDPRMDQFQAWDQQERDHHVNTTLWWACTTVVAVFAFVFALVPLYKMYCQSTGQGQATVGHREYEAPPTPGSRAADRLITVDFNATVHCSLPWTFVPQQKRVVVGLGETSLAFYRAKSLSDKPLIGVSVYHMIPAEAGLYFNKIQCFCFDEQLLNPNEEVDLPLFFFIDPMLAEDPRFDHIDHISLSYVFFTSDSELPDEYSDFIRATRSTQDPLAREAPEVPAQPPLTAA